MLDSFGLRGLGWSSEGIMDLVGFDFDFTRVGLPRKVAA
jgi:hypothetical protein